MSGTIRLDRREDGVAILWIDNPAARNVMDDGMINSVIEHMNALGADRSCRVVVLRGQGGVFCSGRALTNLRALSEATAETVAATYGTLQRLNEAVYYCPRPTVAVLERYALGLGAALSGWCDIALAADDVRIGYPEVRVGLPPAQTTVNLVRSVPRKLAVDLLLTARNITGTEALSLGLVSRTATQEKLDAALEALLAELVLGSPEAMARTKQMIWKSEDVDVRTATLVAVDSISNAITTRDAREGIAAFVEKRRPNW